MSSTDPPPSRPSESGLSRQPSSAIPAPAPAPAPARGPPAPYAPSLAPKPKPKPKPTSTPKPIPTPPLPPVYSDLSRVPIRLLRAHFLRQLRLTPPIPPNLTLSSFISPSTNPFTAPYISLLQTQLNRPNPSYVARSLSEDRLGTVSFEDLEEERNDRERERSVVERNELKRVVEIAEKQSLEEKEKGIVVAALPTTSTATTTATTTATSTATSTATTTSVRLPFPVVNPVRARQIQNAARAKVRENEEIRLRKEIEKRRQLQLLKRKREMEEEERQRQKRVLLEQARASRRQMQTVTGIPSSAGSGSGSGTGSGSGQKLSVSDEERQRRAQFQREVAILDEKRKKGLISFKRFHEGADECLSRIWVGHQQEMIIFRAEVVKEKRLAEQRIASAAKQSATSSSVSASATPNLTAAKKSILSSSRPVSAPVEKKKTVPRTSTHSASAVGVVSEDVLPKTLSHPSQIVKKISPKAVIVRAERTKTPVGRPPRPPASVSASVPSSTSVASRKRKSPSGGLSPSPSLKRRKVAKPPPSQPL